MKVEKIELPKKVLKVLWENIRGTYYQEILPTDIACTVVKGVFYVTIVCIDLVNRTLVKAETERQKVNVKEVKEALLEMMPFCDRCGVIHLGEAIFVMDGRIIGKIGSGVDVEKVAKKIIEEVQQ